MNTPTTFSIKPRKKPVQERSSMTVAAIFEGTIQVLLVEGVERLTTTRVAERAGVSVGTLYQYFPNKQSLLFALLEKHLDHIASVVERTCQHVAGKSPDEMIGYVVEQFVAAKMERPDISTALYRISTDVGGPELVKCISERTQKALHGMFDTAPSRMKKLDLFSIQMISSAMAGTTRMVLEAGAPPEMVAKLREHLILLCQSYLLAVSHSPL